VNIKIVTHQKLVQAVNARDLKKNTRNKKQVTFGMMEVINFFPDETIKIISNMNAVTCIAKIIADALTNSDIELIKNAREILLNADLSDDVLVMIDEYCTFASITIKERMNNANAQIKQVKTYLVKNTNTGQYKIGMTAQDDVATRVAQFHGAAGSTCLIVGFCAGNIELKLHKEYRDKRTFGEWFKLTENDVNEIINVHFKNNNGCYDVY